MTSQDSTFALLGATRGIGRAVLDTALDRGHSVRALVRPGSTLDLEHPSLTIVHGDATNPADITQALDGADALLSAIGTPARAKTPMRTRAAEASVEAMRLAGVRREHLPFFTRAIVFPLYLRRVIADHETQEAAIMRSGLDWTLIRPPYLTDDPVTGNYAIGFGANTADLTWKISRADVAHSMLGALEQRSLVNAAVGLSYRKASAAAA
jgi:putative NADH-flavin reductase